VAAGISIHVSRGGLPADFIEKLDLLFNGSRFTKSKPMKNTLEWVKTIKSLGSGKFPCLEGW